MTGPPHSPGPVAVRLAAVRERIARACERAGRDTATVTLIGISKTFPPEAVAAAWQAGLRDVGENRVQEALPKIARVRELLSPLETRDSPLPDWHLVGHLQTNKAKAAVGAFAILHAIDSERLLQRIAAAADSPVRIMIEVNVSGEVTKYGVAPAELPALLAAATGLPGIRVEGLMTVAPLADDPREARPVFRTLRQLAERHHLPSLSMGMTGDFEVAIEEGATHVRIGRAIFGERTP